MIDIEEDLKADPSLHQYRDILLNKPSRCIGNDREGKKIEFEEELYLWGKGKIPDWDLKQYN